MRHSMIGMTMTVLAAAAMGCSASTVTRPASAVAGGVAGVGSAVAGGVAGAGSAVAGGVSGVGSAVAGGVAGAGSAVTGATIGRGGLVAVLRPVNSATGTVDTSVSLGTVRFTQGTGQVNVVVQVNGVSVAGLDETDDTAHEGYYPVTGFTARIVGTASESGAPVDLTVTAPSASSFAHRYVESAST